LGGRNEDKTRLLGRKAEKEVMFRGIGRRKTKIVKNEGLGLCIPFGMTGGSVDIIFLS